MKLEELFMIDLNKIREIEAKELLKENEDDNKIVLDEEDEEEILDPMYKHILNAVRVALKEEIKPIQADVLWKYYVEDMSMGEISKVLGKHETQIKATLERGEANLRRIIRFAHPDLLKFSIDDLTPKIARRSNASTYLNTRYNWKKDKEES